jgi:DNA-binding winged helix-turn-helix (wHTH) protein
MKEVKNRFYEFEGFRIDAKERVLSKNGEIVPLTFKSFDVLLTLIQNKGRLLEKEELLQSVWAGAIVEEANLKNCISALRKALGDSPHQSRFIQTLPKLGYKFVAPVIALPDRDAEVIVEKYISAEIIIDEVEGIFAPLDSDKMVKPVNGKTLEQRSAVQTENPVQETEIFNSNLQPALQTTGEKAAVISKTKLFKKILALAAV